jgi:hypothetical protein
MESFKDPVMDEYPVNLRSIFDRLCIIYNLTSDQTNDSYCYKTFYLSLHGF